MNEGVVTGAPGRRPTRRRISRRRRLMTHTGPVVVLAAAAFVVGVRVGGGPGRAERRLVTRYLSAYRRGDAAAMYQRLNAESRARVSEPAFAAELRATERTATATRIAVTSIGHIGSGEARAAVTVDTRLWGVLHETLELPFTGSGSGARIRLQSSMLFPGLRPGESLSRRTSLPTRATIEASDGTPLAQGAARTSPIPTVANAISGTLGPIPAAQLPRYAALGFPPGAKIGTDGLELAFQARLAGRPGGTLLAGHRVLARSVPIPGLTVHTTINPHLEADAISALAGRYAGMAVMNPRTGGLEALDGIADNAPQPPGSTMKIVTATGVLQDGLAKISTVFGVHTSVTIDGYTMQNAAGEACGGTLLNAFAVSCNSTYAPLGVRLGARRLVATAQRYGFNQPPPYAGALESTIPSAATIGSPLSVGESAIGQGRVQATPLEMADVAATIADRGRRPIPTLLGTAPPRFVHVTTPKVAGDIAQMMIAVINDPEGTGTSAQIPGVTVAGKTGTAELRDTASKAASNNPKNTDSWFVAYAPAGDPKVVVCALFPGAGYGAATAAPAVKAMIEDALGIAG